MSEKYNNPDENASRACGVKDASGPKLLSDPGKDGQGIDKSARDKDSIKLNEDSNGSDFLDESPASNDDDTGY